MATTPRARPASAADAADQFFAAHATGDKAAVLALCAPHAVAEYFPWGEAGRTPVSRAVDIWGRYPAAFDGFELPVTKRFDDAGARTAIVATINRRRQRGEVDGIAHAKGEGACPHLFVIALDDDGLIARVQVWCDQLTVYRQLGFPRGSDAKRSVA